MEDREGDIEELDNSSEEIMMGQQEPNDKPLEYHTLVCIEDHNKKVDDEGGKSGLMHYTGSPSDTEIKYSQLMPIEKEPGIIADQSKRGMHHMFCTEKGITMYNEPYIQILQSLSGIYRAYFELLEIDQKKYEDKISICIV